MDLGKGTPRCERCRNLSVGLHEATNEYLCQPCWEAADDAAPADTSFDPANCYCGIRVDVNMQQCKDAGECIMRKQAEAMPGDRSRFPTGLSCP